MKFARNKMQMKGNMRFFTKQGLELTDGYSLSKGENIIVCRANEKFIGLPSKTQQTQPSTDQEKPQNRQEDGASGKRGLQHPTVKRLISWWSTYQFLNIKFSVINGEGEFLGETVPDTNELGKKVEESYMTIPEIRELILSLQEVVENPEHGLSWGIYSLMWNTGRETIVYAISNNQNKTNGQEDGGNDSVAWVGFRVEGKPARKGAKKRDGPLWSLEGIHSLPELNL